MSVTVTSVATFTLYLPDRLVVSLDEARGDLSRSLVLRASLELWLKEAYPGLSGKPSPNVERSPEPAEEIPLPKIAKRGWV